MTVSNGVVDNHTVTLIAPNLIACPFNKRREANESNDELLSRNVERY